MTIVTVIHHDVIKWKHFRHYWPFVRGIHRSPVNSPHKGQWRGALMFSFICIWINGWVNSREAGDLRRYRAHYYVTVMNNHNVDNHSNRHNCNGNDNGNNRNSQIYNTDANGNDDDIDINADEMTIIVIMIITVMSMTMKSIIMIMTFVHVWLKLQ